MLKKVKIALLGFAAVTALFTASVSEAGISMYTTSSAFDAAMTGLTLTTTSYANDGASGFPPGYQSVTGSSPYQQAYYGTASIAFAGGGFSLPNGYLMNNVTTFGSTGVNPYGANDFVSNWMTNTGSETINFTTPVTGFSLDGGVLANLSEQSGAASLGFSLGGYEAIFSMPNVLTAVSGGKWSSTGQPLSFMGISSDTPFTSITINDSQGNFSTADITIATTSAVTSASTTAVPAPGSIALLLLALLGLPYFGVRKSFKNRSVL